MKMLVIRDVSVAIDAEVIRHNIKDEVTVNTFPKMDGIAIIDCGKDQSLDWSWPDYTIKVGTCELCNTCDS